LGVQYPTAGVDLEEVWNWRHDDMRCIVNDESGYYYKGYVLGESDNDCMDEESFSSYRIDKMICDVMDALEVEEDEVCIHVGTRSC
jgi:hypothetical protein